MNNQENQTENQQEELTLKIKIEHLRIGNLVEVELLGKVTIESIFLTGQVEVSAFKLISGEITKVFYTFNISELKPIFITEEILLKYGFEKRQESDNFFYFGYGTNPITKDWMLCLKYFQDENRFFFLNGHHNIKYLHQLQNLYFALTKKELIYEK